VADRDQPYSFDPKTETLIATEYEIAANEVFGRTATPPSRAALRQLLLQFKKAAIRMAWVILPLGVLYLYLAAIGLIWTPYTCITDTIQEIANLSSYDFKVTETGCSTIAKTGFVSVYISRAHGTKPILLFKYDPAGVVPYPSIAVSDMRHVTITVPVVSEVFLERYEWRSVSGTVSVDYHIGRVIYPVADVSAPE
jgi:hypothetical protein